MSHKYKIAELVEFIRPPLPDRRLGDDKCFEVIRQLPEDVSGEYSYRVRSPAGVERAARECDIRMLGTRE